MKHIDLNDLGLYSDVLLSRSGELVVLRFARVDDADAIQAYFRGLSTRSRYNRLLGAARELPPGQLERFIDVGKDNGFSLLATVQRDESEMVIGEARYAVDEEAGSIEIGLSVEDAMQRRGIGAALLANLECRAAALGASHLFGDTLRSNDEMLALARKVGFAFAPVPGDCKQVRFEKKNLIAKDGSCANWRFVPDGPENSRL